jgi:large subunit ribosomal protein L28
MSKQCDLTGKRRQIGNRVSHSNVKTKTQNQPNLQEKVVFDPETGTKIKLKLSTRAIKTLDKVGSLSKFLRKNKKFFV